jgi:hypothetical protein
MNMMSVPATYASRAAPVPGPAPRRRTMHKFTFSGLVVAALLALPTAAWAHGGPPETFTDVVKDATVSFPDVNPCTGDPGFNTITYKGVFHVTQFADGHYHITGTQTGTSEFDTTDPALPDYSAHFTLWFGENSNANGFNGTFALGVKATGTDGSSLRFHQTAHITIVGSHVVAQFDKLSCS